MDTISWHVLDATADDWESLTQIADHVLRFCPSVDCETVAQTIVLHQSAGMFREMNDFRPTPVQIVSNPIDYWFEMTELGRRAWKQSSSIFGD